MPEEYVPLTPVAAKPTPPRRRRRWGRRLIVFVVLLAAVVWFAPVVAAKTGLVNALAAKAAGQLRGSVTVGGASLGWLAPVELRDVTVTDAAGRTLAKLPTVRTGKTLLALAANSGEPGEVFIPNPTAEIVAENGTTNLEAALADILAAPSSGGSRPGLVVHVSDASVTIRDGTRSHTLTDVTADVTVPKAAAEPVAIVARGKADAGTFAADLTVGEAVAGTVSAVDFPLVVAEPALRRFDPAAAVGGRLTATVTAAGSHFTGAVAVADLSVTATALGTSPLALKKFDLPFDVTAVGGKVRVAKAELTCDAGTASFTGEIDPAAALVRLLDTPGLTAAADLDLAKLAALAPHLLRARPGTEIREGRIKFDLAGTPAAAGVQWVGAVRASAIRAVRDGKPVAWEQPFEASFAGRLGANRVPAFDRLDVKADFATATVRGTAEAFTATADVSLDKLTAKLADFFDLDGLRLGGTAKLDAAVAPNPAGGSAVRGDVKLTNFLLAGGGTEYREPALAIEFRGDATLDPAGPLRISSGRLTATAGADRLDAKLLEPVADLRAANSGVLLAEVSGDFAKWRARVGRIAGIPASYAIAGTGKITATVKADAATIRVENATGDLANVAFVGAGVTLNEPQVKLYPTAATLDRKTGHVEVTNLQLASQIAGIAGERVAFTATPAGYELRATLKLNANLARVQAALGLQNEMPVTGTVRGGAVTVEVVGDAVKFTGRLPVEKFAVGPAAKPTWAEETLTVTAAGTYDMAADALTLTDAAAARPEGLAVKAAGSLTKLTTVPGFDLTGTLDYDLAKIEPQLRAMIGQTAAVSGKGTRPFRLTGNLNEPGGSAAVAWTSVKAYGFDVGPAELKATVTAEKITFDPVVAAFGQTGQVRVEPTVTFGPGGTALTVAKGKVIDRAKLTPAACAEAIGYALPVLAKSTSAEGTVSFDVESGRVPFADPDKATVAGTLTLHKVAVGPGPFVQEIGTLLGAKLGLVTLADEQKVPIQMKDGRVHHEKLTLTVNGYTITTRGSVGTDGTLSVTAEVPIPDSAVGPLLKNNPKIKDAIAAKKISVPFGGTVNRPQVDARGFQAAVRAFVQDVAKDAAGDLKQELLKKGGGELEKALEKFLPPKKKP